MNRTEQESLKGFPNAYPTSVGWMDPRTGEILVSNKQLKNSAVCLDGIPRRLWKDTVQAHILNSGQENSGHVEIPVEDLVPEVQEQEAPVVEVVAVKEEQKEVVVKKATKKKATKKAAKKKTELKK